MSLWWLLVLAAALACPAFVLAQEPYRDRVDYLINTLLYAHHDGDREDAADDLGKIGDARAIRALEQAAAYDTDSGVRKHAHRAIKKINACRPVVVVQTAVAAAPQMQPAPQVVETPPPQPAPPPPVYVAPAPVVVAPPPPVYYVAPAPVVVQPYYYPAPVYGPCVGGFFSFGFHGYHGYRGYPSHHH